jgi:hypothetical protein
LEVFVDNLTHHIYKLDRREVLWRAIIYEDTFMKGRYYESENSYFFVVCGHVWV